MKIPEEFAFHHTSPSGPKSADHGGSALPFFLQKLKINIHQSAILPPNTLMAISRPTAAGQPYHFPSALVPQKKNPPQHCCWGGFCG
jgi:hypothetical protein